MRGWHFVAVDENDIPRLGYGDGRAVVVGETLTVDCEPALCRSGLHASGRLYDALGYSPRDKRLALCRVTLSGQIVTGDDKAAARARRCEWMLDAETTERVLREFVRWCALEVSPLWDMPDVVREYLETGDESKRNAAETAARDAAETAARDAAETAARDAARDAAWDAARDAAWAAARAAAGDAAGSAFIERAAAELERRAREAREDRRP